MERSYEQLKCRLNENAARVEQSLSVYLDGTDEHYGIIFDSQRYSLLAGGKRIRPFLVNECARVMGAGEEQSMPLACAVEMIHTYSLIHDDLPCMDDDDMRRGRPTNHKKYGEAFALLAGDALLTNAFKIIGQAEALDGETKAKAVAALATAAGDTGMIGGQVIDLLGEREKLDFDTLTKLHAHKTGALIRVSALLGCLSAGYGEEHPNTQKLLRYAEKIGLAFQVIDDILDVTSTEAELGKPIGSDADSNKTTFLSFYTVEEAKKFAEQLTAEALSEISDLDGSETLTDLACYLLERKS